ncbi:MAG: nucleotidyltransferase family protein [Leptolyngbyaceae bacterium]|nr:nucleotidyltransferase family protein [Leptolyngbyaceae bacterium]
MTIVSLILLAAGASTRMGTAKQLLPYGGRSLLRHAAEVAIASICDGVIVVVGSQAERMRSELLHLPLQVVENLRWTEGMGSSIQAGLTEAIARQPDLGAVLIMLADQPLLTSSSLNQFVLRYQQTQCPIVAATYGGTLGVPALFDRRLFPDLAHLPAAVGAKSLIKRYATQAETISLPEGAIDIDTPMDYNSLLSSG